MFGCSQYRRNGIRNAGSRVSRKILDACDATGHALPQSNEAAGVARYNGEAMQHHFGIASIWLTVSFDDKNSWLMQVFSGITVDGDTDIAMLTDKECHQLCTNRNKIRLDYPGLAAINFEASLEILMEEVIGWDMRNNKAMKHVGFFGRPECVTMAVKEQSRKTLHAHFQIWLVGYREMQNNALFGNFREKQKATSLMAKYHKRIASTEFLPDVNTFSKMFDHECTPKSIYTRLPPVMASDQVLRDLRNRKGYGFHQGRIAHCKHCGKTWTNEQIVCSYINTDMNIKAPGHDEGHNMDTSNMSIPNDRLSLYIMKFQRQQNLNPSLITQARQVVNAFYNNHVSCHVKSCFKCQGVNKKRKH